MSTAAICRSRDAMRERRGPRLSVLRRRLRSLRGEGRPAGRRAPAHRAARSARCRELRIAMPMSPAALGVVLREIGAPQPGALGHRLSADHPRRGAARPCVSAARHARRASSSPRATSTSPTPRSSPPTASPSSRCRTTAGTASTSSRCRCCPTCSPSRRRASRAPARPGSSTSKGFVTEGSSTQRLDRHPRRQAWSPGRPITPSSRASPAPWCSTCSKAQGLSSGGARLHGRRGAGGAGGFHHVGEPDRACRWCGSTAGRSATARPA